MDVEAKCSCGNTTVVKVDEDFYRLWKSGKMPIQVAFPTMNVFNRECLLSGLCFDCQSKLFNKPKPGEDWGDIIDECELCGAPLYTKDFDSGVCPVCECGLGE